MKLAEKITVDREGLLINGERLPYYVADPTDDPLVIHRARESVCRVTVTLLAESVEVVRPGLMVVGSEPYGEFRVIGAK